jgi:hypothetical protein
MRNVMKRRRRLGGDPLPYAGILATEPDLFVGLEYAVIGSQQVLWQDAAGTATPVTAIDDPIGCVRHPLTGAIVASQSTLASRPVWLGEGEGAFFDGVDDTLIAPGFASLAFDLIRGPSSLVAGLMVQGTGLKTLLGVINDGSTEVYYVRMNQGGSENIRLLRRSGTGSFASTTYTSSYTLGQNFSLMSAIEVSVNNFYTPAVTVEDSLTTSGEVNPFSYPMTIGATNLRGSFGDFFEGKIRTIAFYKERKPKSFYDEVAVYI